MANAGWPVRCVALGPLAVGTQCWTFAGSANVTVVAKATFEMVPEGLMRLIDPEPIVTAEADGVEFLQPNDLVPSLMSAEVTLQGHAVPATPVSAHRVGLKIARPDATLLEKVLDVYGERAALGATPKPFEAIPLTWANALGGEGMAENPWGRGARSGDVMPHVVDPRRPGTAAGFGPLPATMGDRGRRLGKHRPHKLQGTRIDLPPTLDWMFFQAAPRDQWLNDLRGDEWIMLLGMNGHWTELASQLPGFYPACRLVGAERFGLPAQVPLTPESLHVDADQWRVTVCWRGGFPVPDLGSAAHLRADVVLADAASEPVWPDVDAVDTIDDDSPHTVAWAEQPPLTVALDADDSAPFSQRPPPSVAYLPPTDEPPRYASLPPAGFATSKPKKPKKPKKPRKKTKLPAAARATLVSAVPEELLEPPLPFEATMESRQSPVAKGPIPGAPWSDEPEADVPSPDDVFETVVSGESNALKAAAAEAAAQFAMRQAEERERIAALTAARDREMEKKAREQKEREAKFREEQKEAAERAKKRAAEERAKARADAEALEDDIYGNFG